jgi:nuclear pore complex protein Nup133
MPETSSRFPGTPVETVGELARDFRAESSMVEKMKLEDVYFRVRELAMEELGYEER